MGTLGWMGVPEAARPGWWKGRVRTRRAGCCVTADGVANIQNQLIEWKDIFSRHRLRVSLEKTDVMWWDIEGKSCKYTWMGRSLSKETVLFTWME